MLFLIIYLALIESSQCRGVAIISICCTVRYCTIVIATIFVLFWYLHVCASTLERQRRMTIYTPSIETSAGRRVSTNNQQRRSV